MRKKNNLFAAYSGFTIIELMVATAVFSLVLLVALTGFLQIGHLFYKGVSNAQTQDVTRQVVNDIAGNLKATPGTATVPFTAATSSQPYSYFCAGAYRYTYANYMISGDPRTGKQVQYVSSSPPNYDPSDPLVNMGLVKERVGSGNCPVPCVSSPKNSTLKCPSGVPPITTSTAVEVLGNGMRIGDLSLSKISSSNLYNLSATVVYGNLGVLDYSTTPPRCTGNSSEQRFCAVNQISTSVFEGELQP